MSDGEVGICNAMLPKRCFFRRFGGRKKLEKTPIVVVSWLDMPYSVF